MKKFPIILISGLVLALVLFYKKYKSPTSQLKTLHMELPSMPATLDPSMATDVVGVTELTKVYEGLLEYHYLKRPAELIPNLAEEMPAVSADGLTYTFRIKQGVYFQDNKCFNDGKGKELTADDFVYSLMRVADPKLQSPLFSMMDGRIKGLNEWRAKYADAEYADYTAVVEGIKAIDKYTLQVTLTRPWPQFLHTLTMPHAFAIPKEAVEHYGKEFANHPVGTGPFIIKEFNPQENKIIAYKNPTFREKLYPSEASEECKHLLEYAGRRLPFVDVIETVIITEEQPRWLKFISKKIDIVNLRLMSDMKSKLEGDAPSEELRNSGVLFMNRPQSMTSYYMINNTIPPFKGNKYLRQAISIAFNRAKRNELFDSSLNLMAQSFIPPTLAGYEKDFVNKNNEYSVEEAKKMLAKAGYPGGKGLPAITLEVGNDARARQAAEFFQNCMKEIGISINISQNSWPELVTKSHQGKYMMYAMAWCADYPDAENFLVLFNHMDSSDMSWGGFNEKEYNKLYNEVSVMQDSPERTKLYAKLNRILAEEVPALFIDHETARSFYYSWVKNYEYFDPKRCDFAQYLDVDMEKKKELLGK